MTLLLDQRSKLSERKDSHLAHVIYAHFWTQQSESMGSYEHPCNDSPNKQVDEKKGTYRKGVLTSRFPLR